MSKIEVGPTGRLITGDVLDVSRKKIEERLNDYDPQLYLIWSPEKNNGYGKWTLRRRPEYKSLTSIGEFDGHKIFLLDYVETENECSVFDFDLLNYSLLDRLKKSDLWARLGYVKGKSNQVNDWVTDIEYQEEKTREEHQKKSYDELMYNMNDNKSALRAYREAILSGTNPADLAKYWGK